MKRIFKYLLIAIAIITSIFPLFFILLMSISSDWAWPNIVPKILDLRAWDYVFRENPKTWTAIINSMKIATITVLINIIVAIPAGDALGRYDFKFKKAIEFFLLLPIIIPSIIFTIGIHSRFIKLDLADTMTGVIICHVLITLPYMIRTLKFSFEHLGFDLEEQARMLGANKLNRLLFVVFPFIIPGIVAGATLTVLISVSEYVISALIGGGVIVTLPILMFPFISNGDNIGAVYSILFAVLIILAVLVMDLFLRRYFDEKKGY